MRTLVVGFLGIWPCVDPDPVPIDSGAPVAACELASDYFACPECYSGEVECTFRDIRVVEGSCGDCQARGSLYQELCDLGLADSASEIETQTTCTNLTVP